MKKLNLFKAFEVKESDTMGDAVLKGLAEGFIKGTLASAAGLGIAAVAIKAFSKKENTEKKEVEKTEDEVVTN